MVRWRWFAVLAAALVLAACGSNGGKSLDAGPASSAEQKPEAAPQRTETIVLKPVDSVGRLMPGWSIDQSIGRVLSDCDDAKVSLSSVTPNVWACGAGASRLAACWRTGPNDGACAWRRLSRSLAPIPIRGVVPDDPPSGDPMPLWLELEGGAQCDVRVAGAPPSVQSQHSDWPVYYWCGNNDAAVFAPSQSEPIDKSGPFWTVQYGPYEGTLSATRVLKAYFVGVA